MVNMNRHKPRLTALLLVTLAAALALASAVGAEEKTVTIPAGSLEMLQGVFARVADLLWEKSDDYFHEGYHERCISVMRLVTEIDPTDVRAFAVGSWLIDSRGRDAEGIAFLERGLALNSDRYDLYAELGHRYFHMENYPKAAQYFQAATGFKDCPVTLWHMLAHSYEKSGLLEKAVQTWEHSAVLEPDDPVVQRNLDRVKKQLAAHESQHPDNPPERR